MRNMSQAGERIRYIREQFGFNQAELAKTLGIHRGHVSRIETGSAVPSDQLIKLICNTFNINESWLREGNPPMRGEVDNPMVKKLEGEILDRNYDRLATTTESISLLLAGALSIIVRELQKVKEWGVLIDPTHPEYIKFDAARKKILSEIDQIKELLNSI